MKIVKALSNKVKNFIKGSGGALPKLFVWLYASVFIACGLLTIVGVCHEFFTKGVVNYKAVNDFVKEYFAPSICGTFAILGVLLIDKNKDGIPDKWEQEQEEQKR